MVAVLALFGLMAMSGQAFAAKVYHHVPSSFMPFGAGVFLGVAVDNSTGTSAGDIYAVGEGRTIYQFQPNSTLVREVAIPESDGERTQGIAVDSSSTATAGDVYVVVIGPPPGGEPPGTPLPTHGAIYRLTTNGTLSPFVTGITDSPTGIAVGPSGEVFLAQQGEPGSRIGDVLEYSSSGTPLNSGKPIIEGLEYPHGIAVDSHDDLYVSNCSRGLGIVQFTPTGGGSYSAAKTIDPESGCQGSDLAVDSSNGYLFFSDDNVVRVFDSDGSQIALGSEEQGATSTYRYFAVGVSEATGDIYAINSAAGFPTDSTLEEAEPGAETPVIESELVSNLPEGGATFEVQINPNGHETAYEFLLNGTQVGTGHIPAGESGKSVSVEVSNLEAGSRYTFSVVANSSEGTVEGPERNFTAGNPPGPQSETKQASNLTDTSATLNGIVFPDGAQPTITYFFEYGTSTSYGASAPTPVGEIGGRVSCGLPCGNGDPNQDPADVSTSLTGLETGTTYHYRLVATGPNSYRSYGKDETFTAQNPGPEAAPSEVVTETAERTSGGFKLKGELNPENSPTTYYFIYKEAGAVECEDLEGCGPETTHGGPLIGDTQQEVPALEVTGLEPETTYTYWLIAKNAKGTVRGNELTFTTQPAPPEAAPSEVVTEPADAGSNGYRLNGRLNPGNSPTTYYFEYIGDNEVECLGGENCWPETVHAGPITGDSQQGIGSIEVTGLRLGETYRYRLVAENAKGTERGNVLTFTVMYAYPPIVGSESVSSITESGATLEAQVNPRGEESYRTTWVFEYGTSTSYGQSVPSPPGVFNSEACRYIEIIPCGINSPQPVSESLTGLEPGTTYHYRIAATNSWGTSYGTDAMFTTQGRHARPLGGEETPPGAGGNETPPTNGSGNTGTTSGSGESSTPGVKLPLVSTLGNGSRNGEPKVLSRAQKLSKALELCRKKGNKDKRRSCERLAHQKYGAKPGHRH